MDDIIDRFNALILHKKCWDNMMQNRKTLILRKRPLPDYFEV